MKQLHTMDLELAYEDRTIVKGLNLQIPPGKITALVGRNGSGKSTILQSLARLLRPKSGTVYLDGKSIHTQATREVAKSLAILPQGPEAPEGLTVEGLVSHGRYPYQKLIGGKSEEDQRMVQWALEVTGTAELADRPLTALSGGQRQRVWIAMALAQDTELLLLDEPTTFLDMAHQLEVLELLKKLNMEANRTIVMVVHDLNHAARYADHLVTIYNGEIVSEGPPQVVLNSEMLEKVFGVKSHIIYDPETNTPLCIPYKLVSQDPKDEGKQSMEKMAVNK
ncbi:ABC transporter ATP-binding protein [Paenibacillus sp. BR2-3]|uniref:ABC transporter ATP-binding protein n=1 Tax=Paenibacillus sp. BR2-3 TaxID=3048494 RepID=UPI003977D9F7